MKNLKKFQTQEAKEKIRLAIENAESKSSAEILPMIVSASTSHDYLWPILTLIFAILATALYYEIDLFHFYPLEPWMVLILFAFSALALGWALSKVGPVQRWFTHNRHARRAVHQRALVEFYGLKLDHTTHGTGILLFLSLQERMAVVLADPQIAEKLPPQTWTDVIKKLVSVARQDSVAALIEAINECGNVTSSHFPPKAHRKNELPDRLIIKN